MLNSKMDRIGRSGVYDVYAMTVNMTASTQSLEQRQLMQEALALDERLQVWRAFYLRSVLPQSLSLLSLTLYLLALGFPNCVSICYSLLPALT